MNSSEIRIKCTRCKMNLTVDKYKKKRDDTYQKRCLECNETERAKKRCKPAMEYGGNNSEFKEHIEAQFQEGMSWDNYGAAWHIDHIVPLKYKELTLEEVAKRLHYSNTQPLWAAENIAKGNRFIG